MISKTTMASEAQMDYELQEDSDENDIEIDNDDGQDKLEKDSKLSGNPGWADVFKKILKTNKPKKKKTLVLSRAKKLPDVSKNSKDSKDADSVDDDGKKTKSKSKPISLRKKPSVLDRNREKILQKIATKGVVQLFNSVEQQQSHISKKLEASGPLFSKQEKILQNIDKRAFLDMLMGNTKSISVDDTMAQTKIEKCDKNDNEEKLWSVLRDDFVMGAKLKDWDTQQDDNDSSSVDSEEENIDCT